ncbi:MAG: hypothetical protein GY832_17975 [Chloroflexi bacterium]|nr:hypothetical protein [Chloroflexota bacterium]
MVQLVNPRMTVKVFGIEDISISDPFMEFDITKDLDEEPNEAEVYIYNLSEGTRQAIQNAYNQSAPIEIHLTPSGVDELVMAFRGEIDAVKSRPTRPGWETYLRCTSQKDNHRAFFVDQKTFKKGTPIADIVNFFVDTIGLPKIMDTIPTTGILLSESFSGPAFPLLRRYCDDLGMYAYILDGVLHVSSIYDVLDPTVYTIDKTHLLATPEPTTRTDDEAVQMKTIFEAVSPDIVAKQNRRRKKRSKTIKVFGENDYADYTAVDTLIEGMDFECLLQPDVQPDQIVGTNTDALDGLEYRVTEVNHRGTTEDFSEWTTELKTDLYESP